jgi:hypothetical protein
LEREIFLISLLALSTGGACTFSAVSTAAAHHPQLDRAQMVCGFSGKFYGIQPHTVLEIPTKLHTRVINYLFRFFRVANRFVA